MSDEDRTCVLCGAVRLPGGVWVITFGMDPHCPHETLTGAQ